MEFHHLKKKNMTYSRHFKRAILISLKLIVSGICTIIHAVYPDIMVTTASDTINELHKELNEEDPRSVQDPRSVELKKKPF